MVARHGAPGPDVERYAERLGEHLASEIDGLEESAALIDAGYHMRQFDTAERSTP